VLFIFSGIFAGFKPNTSDYTALELLLLKELPVIRIELNCNLAEILLGFMPLEYYTPPIVTTLSLSPLTSSS
jgi:hypothetical protein